MLALYRERMAKPHLMGRDLLEAGIEPGPLISEALAAAHSLRLAGEPKESQLKSALAFLRQAEKEKRSKA
jgi:tRNA nucleotidyltransferase (CCA-adding enzyme)